MDTIILMPTKTEAGYRERLAIEIDRLQHNLEVTDRYVRLFAMCLPYDRLLGLRRHKADLQRQLNDKVAEHRDLPRYKEIPIYHF